MSSTTIIDALNLSNNVKRKEKNFPAAAEEVFHCDEVEEEETVPAMSPKITCLRNNILLYHSKSNIKTKVGSCDHELQQRILITPTMTISDGEIRTSERSGCDNVGNTQNDLIIMKNGSAAVKNGLPCSLLITAHGHYRGRRSCYSAGRFFQCILAMMVIIQIVFSLISFLSLSTYWSGIFGVMAFMQSPSMASYQSFSSCIRSKRKTSDRKHACGSYLNGCESRIDSTSYDVFMSGRSGSSGVCGTFRSFSRTTLQSETNISGNWGDREEDVDNISITGSTALRSSKENGEAMETGNVIVRNDVMSDNGEAAENPTINSKKNIVNKQRGRTVVSPRPKAPVKAKLRDKGDKTASSSLQASIQVNKRILSPSTATPHDVLSIFMQCGGARGYGGNQSPLNSINFATLVHRIAKLQQLDHMVRYDSKNEINTLSDRSGTKSKQQGVVRKNVLSDPRFAILLCTIAERLSGDLESPSPTSPFFPSRELGNISWALAKLKHLVPPPQGDSISKSTPIMRFKSHYQDMVDADDNWISTSDDTARNGVNNGNDENNNGDLVLIVEDRAEFAVKLTFTCKQLRSEIIQIARQQQQHRELDYGVDNQQQGKSMYIPTLRSLAAQIMDAIAVRVMDLLHDFKNQELAILLWSYAASQRGSGNEKDSMLCRAILEELLKKNSRSPSYNKFHLSTNEIRPQELSNSMWAMATMGVIPMGGVQAKFIRFVADCMNDERRKTSEGRSSSARPSWGTPRIDAVPSSRPSFLQQYKPQELGNTAWSASTILAKLSSAYVSVIPSSTNGSDRTFGQSRDEASTNMVVAAVKDVIRACTRELRDRAEEYKPQEISNTLWACASINFGALKAPSVLAESSLSLLSSLSLPPSQEEEEKVLMCQALTSAGNSAVKRLRFFRPQELNNMVWSYARLLDPAYVKQQIRLSEGEGSDKLVSALGSSQSYAVSAWQAFEVAHNIFQEVGRQILNRIDTYAPQDVGTSLWSFATIGYRSSKGEPEDGMDRQIDTEEPTSFAAFSLGTATPNIGHITEIDNIYRAAASRLNFASSKQYKPQELSNAVWALAKSGMIPRDLSAFDTLVENASSNGMLPSCYLGNDPVTICFGSVANELMRRPWEFKEQELKDVLWSLSKVGLRHPALFQRVAEHLVGDGKRKENFKFRGLMPFNSQGLANIAWSYGRQAQLAGAIADLDSKAITGRLAVYKSSSQDIGEDLVVRLFVGIGDASVAQTLNGLDRFSPQDISNTAWAFATLGLVHNKFFKAAAEQMCKRLPIRSTVSFKPQEIGNLMWAFATLNIRYPEMLDVIELHVATLCHNGQNNGLQFDDLSISRRFIRQELTNILWSCAVLRKYPAVLVSILYTGLLGNSNEPQRMRHIMKDIGLQRQAIMCLLHVQLALDLEAPDLNLWLPLSFPTGWGELGPHGKTIDTPTFDVNQSRFQSSVSKTLTRVGFKHVQEHNIGFAESSKSFSRCTLEFLSVDVADVDRKIAIEVDGPAHFVTSIDRVDLSDQATDNSIGDEITNRWRGRRYENGPTALKDRLLRQLGWKVAHIPYWEWSEMNGNSQREQDYCMRLLKNMDH